MDNDELIMKETASTFVVNTNAWSWGPAVEQGVVHRHPATLTRKKLPFREEFRRAIEFPSDFPIKGDIGMFDMAEDFDDLPPPLDVVIESLPPRP